MNILKHVTHQPFVFATGVAALVHSTWSLGTLFSGEQPAPDFTDFQNAVHFIGWIVPSFLIAFALDVGQIATSAEIRAGQRNWRKYATFAVFAGATYYLQWLYMAHHMPELALAPGVRETWSWFAQLIRDAAIWFIPALLPLSTLLYTFSHEEHEQQQIPIVTPQVTGVSEPAAPLLEPVISEVGVMLPETAPAKIIMTCPNCDWSKEYDDLEKAQSGLKMHQRRYCVSSPVASSNGQHHG